MLNQLRVRSRLILLSIIPLCFLVLLAVMSLKDMRVLAKGVDSLYQDRVMPLQQLKTVSDAYAVTIVDTLHKYRAGLLSNRQASTAITSAEQQAKSMWQAYLATELTSRERELVNVAAEHIAVWTRQVQQYQASLDDETLKNEANEAFNQTLYAKADPLSQALNELVVLQQEEAGRFTQQAQQQLEQMLWFFSVLVVLVVVGVIVFAVFITRSIQQPLSALRHCIVSVGEHADFRLRAEVQGRDEITETAEAFNQTVARMQQFFRSINDAVLQMAAASDQMQVISQQVSKTANEQEMQANMIATAVNQMSAAIQEVANSALATSGQANQTDQSARSGVQQVGANIASIEQLSGMVSATGAVISELHQETDKITQVLAVIQTIAAQTNLLALNAAIEAARAGEAGRGFAVVADEVRTLATNTQRATESIRTMIDTLQQKAKEAVHSMQESHGHAQGSVNNAQQAGVVLDQIQQAVQRIVDMNVQICTATEQQTVVAEEINRNVTEFNSSISEVSRSSAQSADASSALAELANRLRQQTAQFQV
jgi:methyl-accepting chemotaxis protein